MKSCPALIAASFLLTLSGCQEKKAGGDEAEISSGRDTTVANKVKLAADTGTITPMAERVATIGLLNKRNGQTREITLKPGEKFREGKVAISLRACEATAPWEPHPDQGAFVQIDILERPAGTQDAERWHRVFSGWLFRENPAANILQHPVYDVWVKQCNMSFPGDEKPLDRKSSAPAEESAESNADQSADGGNDGGATAPAAPSPAN